MNAKDTQEIIYWQDKYLELYEGMSADTSTIAKSLQFWRNRALAAEKNLDRELRHAREEKDLHRNAYADADEKAAAHVAAAHRRALDERDTARSQLHVMTASRDQWKADCEKAHAELAALKAQPMTGGQYVEVELSAVASELRAVTAERDRLKAYVEKLEASASRALAAMPLAKVDARNMLIRIMGKIQTSTPLAWTTFRAYAVAIVQGEYDALAASHGANCHGGGGGPADSYTVIAESPKPT